MSVEFNQDKGSSFAEVMTETEIPGYAFTSLTVLVEEALLPILNNDKKGTFEDILWVCEAVHPRFSPELKLTIPNQVSGPMTAFCVRIRTVTKTAVSFDIPSRMLSRRD